MTHSDDPELVRQADDYLGFWNDLIASALERRVGCGVTIAPAAAPAGPPSKEDAGLCLRVFGGKAGEQLMWLSDADAVRLTRSQAGDPTGEATTLTAEQREGIVSMFQQLATMVPAADWTGFAGELEVSEAAPVEWKPSVAAAFRFSTPEGLLCDLHSFLSADFVSALAAQTHPPKAPPHAAETVLSAAEEPLRSASAPIHDVNLDLLMDVELDAILRFGQRRMPLSEILTIAPGAVVELDQQVHDPAELLIGDKVIALGEIVVVEGNYGFRVTGLASREERLESLRK